MAAGGMAAGGKAQRGGKPRPAKGGAARKPASKPAPKRPAKPAPAPEPALTGTFRLGAIPGATPGKWIDTWKQRMPLAPLDLVPLEMATQRDALVAGEVDAAIVRLPLDRDGLHAIPLYEEVTVVICSVDSHLTAADELTDADLAGEVRIVPLDDVLDLEIAGTEAPRFAAPATTADAVATVASGVGIVVVPMSLARLHHRKDVEYRPLVGAPASAVALAWPVDGQTPLVDAFIGIVRGRTANSSRA
ncbi:LysR family substrate-binding domain-containing protein [Microbacterium dauci]|uniref:LysR family substrate-binding domain-containing protein n=1 Tax=Microbacterium dauci TaxID=3048008 RepID=A0ABT6ZH90_9MICO|nr:LysR family substrate-binding domain-containing protein [Microbacterium sp. LX3-4]MDJ1115488.1 LysR family substrate-binding domain-containing protein [Microbacterium sp. LX3-4]